MAVLDTASSLVFTVQVHSLKATQPRTLCSFQPRSSTPCSFQPCKRHYAHPSHHQGCHAFQSITCKARRRTLEHAHSMAVQEWFNSVQLATRSCIGACLSRLLLQVSARSSSMIIQAAESSRGTLFGDSCETRGRVRLPESHMVRQGKWLGVGWQRIAVL
eukprot:6467986-Amphidinium_carterae.2